MFIELFEAGILLVVNSSIIIPYILDILIEVE